MRIRLEHPNYTRRSSQVTAALWHLNHPYIEAYKSHVIARVHGFTGKEASYGQVGGECGMRYDEVSKLYRISVKELLNVDREYSKKLRTRKMDYVQHPEDFLSKTYWTKLINSAGLYRSEVDEVYQSIGSDLIRDYVGARHSGLSLYNATRSVGRKRADLDSVAVMTLLHLVTGSKAPAWRPRLSIQGVPKILEDAHFKAYHDFKYQHGYLKTIVPASAKERGEEFKSALNSPINTSELAKLSRQYRHLGFRVARIFQQAVLKGQVIEIANLPIQKLAEVIRTVRVTDWRFTSLTDLEIDWMTRCSHDELETLVKTSFLQMTDQGFKSTMEVKTTGEI